MKIFSHENQTETTFGITINGNYSKIVHGKDFAIAYVTPSVHRYLNWICEDEIKKEVKRENDKLHLLKCISFWELAKASGCFRGQFDCKQYAKILENKSQLVEATFTGTCSRIPKVKLKTIYPTK